MTAWTEGNVQFNDITTHYYRTGAQNKPSVLLLHDITDSGRCWSPLATDLAGSYNVVMMDVRGHGHYRLQSRGLDRREMMAPGR